MRQHILMIASYDGSLINFRGDLLQAMRARGHQVSACAPDPRPEVAARLAEWGVQLHAYPLQRTGLNPFSDIRTRFQLAGLIRRLRPTHTLAYTIKPAIYGSLAAQAAGVPQVHAMITGMGTAFAATGPLGRPMRAVAELLYRKALARCEGVFFQNPDDLGLFLDRNLAQAEQCTLIAGSGVNLEHFAFSPVPTGAPRFVTIARLLAEKGIREFADAARIVKARFPQASFVLVGPCERHPRAIPRHQVQAWETEGLLEYRGSVDDVRPVLQETSVYCLASYREGLPRTVLEAMACGRAVITTRAPGCRETVQEGENGFLVPVRDAAALATAMIRFCEAPNLIETFGQRSRELVAERFDVNLVNTAILDAMRL